MEIVSLVLVALLGAAGGAAGVWFWLGARAQNELSEALVRAATAEAERDSARAEAAAIRDAREALTMQFRALADEAIERQTQRVDAAAEQRLQATHLLMAPVKESLGALQQKLSEVESNRKELSAELRGQIEQVQKVGEDVRLEAKSLVNALRKPQQRGAWGELQLRRVVELAGMLEHCDFYLQDSTTTSDGRQRPDMKVFLGDGKFIFVDSKVPLNAFLDLENSDDEVAHAEALTTFARHVKTHIDQLSAKQYWSLDAGTPDFVILFVPSDALAFEALQQLPDLYEYATKRQIILASPTSLIATLRAVAYGWKQAALADSAREISELGKVLYERLAAMGGNFDKLGRNLQTAVRSYNETVGSFEGRLLPTARKFRDLKVTDAEFSSPAAIEEAVRDLAAPELVADASTTASIAGAELRFLTRESPTDVELVDGLAPVKPSKSRRSAS